MKPAQLLVLVTALALCAAAPTTKKAPDNKKGSKSAPAVAGDWPCWRGTDRTGISTEHGLLKSWPSEGPRLLWKTTGLGEGFSTPSVAGNLIFVMGNREGQEFVMALDRSKEGKEVWATSLGQARHGGGGYPGPRCTPTVDGNRVYALGLSGDLVCLDVKNGRVVWHKNLVADFGGSIPNWGYAESPLIDGLWVLCTPGGQQATMVAMLKTTGKPVWQAAIGDQAGYASIIPAEIGGIKQFVQFTAKGVIGVNAKSGDFLWRYDAPANGTANIPTPVAIGDSVFAASGYGTGGGLVEVHRGGARFDTVEKFFSKEMKNHHGGLIVLDGYLYGSDDPGILTCIDLKTGQTKWKNRGPGKCALVYADGMLYCRSERGPVTLVKATPEAYEELGRFDQPDRSSAQAWPHPVIADGRLYLRDQDVLLCYEIRGTGT
jgi:outer membrane protein assembly factor BamB